MSELKATEDHVAAKLTEENDKQQAKLAERLAKRKGRRAALARDECKLKQEQAEEAARQ